MVEIRRLSLPKPAVQIRSLTSPELDPHSRRTGLRPERIKVVKRLRKDHLPPTPMPTPCVIWQGSADPQGYGRRKVLVGVVDGQRVWKPVSMHRWVIQQVLGRDLTPDEVILHLCDNPICYRYDHLKLGTVQMNNLDMLIKKRNVLPPQTIRHGETNGNAKYSDDDVADVLNLLELGKTQAQVAIQLGISKSHVQRIAAGTARRQP